MESKRHILKTKTMKLELRTALELKANAFIGATFEELILPEGMIEIQDRCARTVII